ncbi:MAG: SUMF1/EgtB/PvdO family nonheme iron enzyme [Akkermansiaceae bacterium]|nr:SUMF1/EgtB/PvdO family nonheme iron enzyme [Akkermansiaceae bacterium]
MPTEPEHTFTPGTHIGDYLMGELISKGTNTSTWTATQISVQREVSLCALDDGIKKDPASREGFISDVRTKASVDHPLIASVLEAVNEGDQCFFAMEKLHGKNLASCHDEGTSISPIQTARIIRNIAGACNYLEAHGIASLPLSPHDIYIDDKYHCRIANMAISGAPDPSVGTQDKEMVGRLMQDLLEPGQPGSTRTSSLCDYMADREREQALTWMQIHDLADKVERQLAEPNARDQIQSPTMRMRPDVSHAAIGQFLSILAILLIIGGLVYYFSTRKTPPAKRQMRDMVHIPAGKYPGPDGFQVKMRDFWIDAHEVTIGEYAEFLEVLDQLADDMKTVYQHEEQPKDKTSHEPDDWANLLAAAKEGETWNTLHVDLNYPVVGVDWWDAYAYAVWKGRRLPTREEWYAACSAGSDPSKLEASGWSPVDQTEQTSHGICGMAGNVSEWMRKKCLNPADPSLPPRYVICGASYLRPKYGARAREWVDDRSLRRNDLGFRTLSNSPQED